MKLVLIFLMITPSYIFALTFGPYVQISPSGNNGTPQLVVSTNGDAFATWVHFPNVIQAAFFNIKTGLWTNFNIATNSTAPDIGIDGFGNAFITWVTTASTGLTQIFVQRFNATTLSFSNVVQLSFGGYNSAPQIAVSGTGNALIVWIQNAPFAVLASSYNVTTNTWSAPIQISTSTAPALFALDNLGTGFGIIDSFSTQVQGAIQVSRITVP